MRGGKEGEAKEGLGGNIPGLPGIPVQHTTAGAVPRFPSRVKKYSSFLSLLPKQWILPPFSSAFTYVTEEERMKKGINKTE